MDNEKKPLIVDLPEGLLLLATDDESGRISSKSGALDYGLGGAVLTELLLKDHLIIQGGKVRVLGTDPTGDPILDGALEEIANSKLRDAKHWVSNLPRSHLRDKVLERLTQKGILQKEEHRILWVIPDDRYPAQDDAPEADVRNTIRATVLEGAAPRPGTAALIGILKACDLLDTVFSREERKLYNDQIDRIANAELMSAAVSKAVQDMQAAVLAAVTATTAVTVTTGSSN